MTSPFSQSSEETDFPKKALHTYNGCPAIDLRPCDESMLEGVPRVDLHPVYNKNPRKHLLDEIFKHQLAYERSETKENKIYIITGTGKKRAGPNFTLRNVVEGWLKEDYCSRRISEYKLGHEGFFAVFLRKNKIDL